MCRLEREVSRSETEVSTDELAQRIPRSTEDGGMVISLS